MTGTQIAKILIGIFLVPLGLVMAVVWPWWEKTNLINKILTGVVIVPIAGILFGLSEWWEEL
jgi:uncharacterized membrane protein